nr:MAG TPA: hypothetical protein [Herelleviridae sp.]
MGIEIWGAKQRRMKNSAGIHVCCECKTVRRENTVRFLPFLFFVLSFLLIIIHYVHNY